MVEYTFPLDSIFSSLSDPTRRDILSRVARCELSINEIAGPYRMSLAAISKHLKILEKAKLIVKRRAGKQQLVSASPATLHSAAKYLSTYERMWNDRFDALDQFLAKK